MQRLRPLGHTTSSQEHLLVCRWKKEPLFDHAASSTQIFLAMGPFAQGLSTMGGQSTTFVS
ncbi:MAG: hypothetical protein ACRC6N_07465 [Plesiomonas sp.]|uniref:hypothetical protein n=1 Tax=Plesiomonas sp. TaxID=2486279 RepID=UPI003F3BAC43